VIGGVLGAAVLLPACYLPPVDGRVVDPFRAPACTYCPGNRGLEYRPQPGSPVVAAADGRVTFNGMVAGVRYVVVAQTDGRTATYGDLAATTVAKGVVVRRGQSVGISTGRLYFGIRESGVYVDPAPLLGRWRVRPRLVPTDGSAPRRAPPAFVCASRRARR
jgi:murein DD-endopeptidase MepM/ murein hydrolase activator NlpD